MVELRRSVRFHVNLPDPSSDPDAPASDDRGGGDRLAAFYELEVACAGEPDPDTGYLVNISDIDEVVRRDVVPRIQRVCATTPRTSPAGLLGDVLADLQPALGKIVAGVTWRLTPYHSISIRIKSMERVTISQTFEYSASHRLHCAAMSPQENQATFGKCNNPNGHGHNYRVEVAAGAALDNGHPALTHSQLERIVTSHVLDRFDHKHLNLDVDLFAKLNPSVENIARVCYELLTSPIDDAGGQLEYVRVWETEKTSCTYPARTAGS